MGDGVELFGNTPELLPQYLEHDTGQNAIIKSFIRLDEFLESFFGGLKNEKGLFGIMLFTATDRLLIV